MRNGLYRYYFHRDILSQFCPVNMMAFLAASIMSSGCSFYDTRQLSAKIVVGEESLTKFEKILIGFFVSTLRPNSEYLIENLGAEKVLFT